MLVRIPGDSISQIGRNTSGVRLVNLKDGDAVVATAKVFESEEQANDGAVDTVASGDSESA